MPAFARGLAAGADGFECDVRLSADGVPVVIHDATLDRTTDRTGPVAALTAERARRASMPRAASSRPPTSCVPTPRVGIVPLARGAARVSRAPGSSSS